MTNFEEPDLEAVHAAYSAMAAHYLSGQPVWPMIVAPPGTGKTEIVNGVSALQNVHMVDSFTPHTFLSGRIDENNPDAKNSLLKRIGSNGIIVISDFSTILAMRPESRETVLADLRRIYDGKLRKEFGIDASDEARSWEGRITLIAAATPDVDRRFSSLQSLGERMVTIRPKAADPVAAAIRAMNQNQCEVAESLKEAVGSVFRGIDKRGAEPKVTEEFGERLANLAAFVVRARTHVEREGRDKKIEVVPQPEAPTRLSQQLTQMAKGSALLSRRAVVIESDYQLAVRVALDCVREPRRTLLKCLIDGGGWKDAGLPKATLSYVRGDLRAMLLLDDDNQFSSLAIEYLTTARVL